MKEKVKVEPLAVVDTDEQINENSQIKKVLPYEGTPLDIVEVDESFFVALGKYRLTELLPTFEEAKAYIEHKEWNMLIGLIHAIVTETIATNQQIDEMVKKQQDYEKKNGKTIN